MCNSGHNFSFGDEEIILELTNAEKHTEVLLCHMCDTVKIIEPEPFIKMVPRHHHRMTIGVGDIHLSKLDWDGLQGLNHNKFRVFRCSVDYCKLARMIPVALTLDEKR